jgi:hypothetical protein
MYNNNYSIKKTVLKGINQILVIISSTAFSSLFVAIIKEITDKDFSITDVQKAMESISSIVVCLVPVVSSMIQMMINFKKNYKIK